MLHGGLLDMKIATWNVNSLTARLQHVLDWLAANPVDVLCLQELKLDATTSSRSRCCGRPATNTRGVRAEDLQRRRDPEPGAGARRGEEHRRLRRRAFARDRATLDTPAGELRMVNGYFVNGQAPGSEKFDYKMKWLRGLRDWLREELARTRTLVLLGDFNIAPEDRDSFDPVGLRETHPPHDRGARAFALLELGLTDSFRLFEQPEKSYTWWDYRMLGYQKNRGLRIDHILVSEPLVPVVKACVIDRVPRKWKTAERPRAGDAWKSESVRAQDCRFSPQ